MNDEVEQMAKIICKTNPVTVGGEALDWEQVVHLQPGQAAKYVEAATNRIRAAEAMLRLERMPARRLIR